MQRGTLLLGLASGAVLGLTLGLLLAPRTGTDTRCHLAETAHHLKEAAAEYGRRGPLVLLLPVSISVSTSTTTPRA